MSCYLVISMFMSYVNMFFLHNMPESYVLSIYYVYVLYFCVGISP